MVDLSSLGEGTSAVWTRRAAEQLGSARSVDRRLATEWQSPYPSVLADAGYVLDAVQWATAGVLASGGEVRPVAIAAPDARGRVAVQLRAMPCGRDAARVWGFPLVDDDDPATGGLERFEHDVHVWTDLDDLVAPLVPGDPRPHVLHRHTLTFYAGELVQHPSGLWLPTPLRTALDCAVLLPFEAAVCVMDDGLHRALFTPGEVSAALALRVGHPGVERQRAVAHAADGRAEAASETLLRLLLKPDWPELEPQVTLYDARGYPLRRYDLGDRSLRLGLESDGKKAHAGEQMAAKDHGRDRTAWSRYRWWTERATWWQIRCRPDETRARILAVRDRMRARPAA